MLPAHRPISATFFSYGEMAYPRGPKRLRTRSFYSLSLSLSLFSLSRGARSWRTIDRGSPRAGAMEFPERRSAVSILGLTATATATATAKATATLGPVQPRRRHSSPSLFILISFPPERVRPASSRPIIPAVLGPAIGCQKLGVRARAALGRIGSDVERVVPG